MHGASTILHDAAKRVHLHVIAGLGVFAAHRGQLAQHHGGHLFVLWTTKGGHALNVGGQSQLAALTSRPKPGLEWKKFATKLDSQVQRRENVGDHIALAGHAMTGA